MGPSVPSWLLPGGWLANLRAAQGLGWVGGMELLLFSFEGEDRGLFLEESPRIEAEGRGLDLGIHLPDPLLPAHREILEATARYANYYVVHPGRLGPVPARGAEAFASFLGALRRDYGDRFLLEYTNQADFDAAMAVLPGMGICADSAHLLAEGLDPAAWLGARKGQVREIHLNGLEGGQAHRPLRGDEAWLGPLLPFLREGSLRVELEVFSLAGVESSYQALKELQ